MARDRQLESIIDSLLLILEEGTKKEDRVLESIRSDQTIFDFEVQVEETFGFLFKEEDISLYEEETVLDLAKRIQEYFG